LESIFSAKNLNFGLKYKSTLIKNNWNPRGKEISQDHFCALNKFKFHCQKKLIPEHCGCIKWSQLFWRNLKLSLE
jgi:hypothetical protein